MKRYGIFHRMISLVLTMVLVLGMIPVFAAAAEETVTPAAQTDTRIVDPNTMNQWKDYFGPDKISTEFAGGVWTDKSVMTNADAFQAQITMDDPDNNFLIALSALAANQQIVGYATAPIDVMLVMDVSGSMSGEKATTMVQAANQTLNSLLTQNNNNRVGVVLYSGNTSTTQNATANSATVLLPLDYYTTTSTQNVDGQWIPAYLTISNSTVSVATGLRNSNNQKVYGNKSVTGGTYIQNGIYKAWGEFSGVTDVTVPEGQAQAGAQRIPVMILFSDGQPTVATSAYNNIANSEKTYGNGAENSTTWQTVFLTQLTAAWAKGKMSAHYGTKAKFYSIGLGTGNSTYATAVLNPSSATDDTLNNYWNNYFNASKLDKNGNVSVSNNWKLVKDGAVSSKGYVDTYKLATNASDLINVFKQIVETIELDTAGHVTLVEGAGEDLSGYITFTDELGIFMEVKEVKGLVLGNNLFTGSQFIDAVNNGLMGTKDSPTDLGNEFIRSVRERLGGLDVGTAQALVGAARQDGQIATDAQTGKFSNYLGWYSNDAGAYLGFWDKDTGITAEGAPEGATWINKSYLFLGEAGSSDMMHIVVLVATHIASGMQVVQYKIPASLIPKVTYEVELEGSDGTKMTSITRKEAFPLRLVYEIGLYDEINEVNVADIVKAAEDAGYGHSHIEPDGSYAFYTNKWGAEHGDTIIDYTDPQHHEVAKSHFHPAVGNDRYYYTADTLIYSNTSGTAYNGNTRPSGTGYYRAHNFYTASGYTTEYIPVAEEALTLAVKKSDGWYVPAGTVFQQIDRFKMLKSTNATGTLEYYDHPVVVKTEDKYDTYAYLGNNGKIVIDPQQGIKLSKTVTETVDGAPENFTFHITLSQAVANPKVTDPDGQVWTGAWSVDGAVITVSLKAGETVYITDLPTGVTYTVTEVANKFYQATSTNATGTVENNVIKPVDFVNTPKGYGNLIISKDVDHPFVNLPEAMADKEFTISVTLSGPETANAQFALAGTDPVEYVTTDANGRFTVKLKDNGSVTVTGLPENTTFVTTESLDANEHKGFTMDESRSVLSGTIVKDSTVQTHVVNVYAPAAPETKVQIGGKKVVTDETGAFDWTGNSFTFRLEAYDPATGTYTTLGEKKVTNGDLNYLFADEMQFTALGSYYFKVSEVIPADRVSGMSYDATTGRIEVRVTDEDVDGVMELAVYDFDTGLPLAAENGVVTYEKDFENIYTTDATFVEFPVYKHVTDPHNTGVTEAGFLFELYEVVDGNVSTSATYSMRTVMVDGQGQAVFHIPVAKVGVRTFILKENSNADANKIPGMVYDESEYTVTVTGYSEGGKLYAKAEFTKGGTDVAAEDVAFANVIDLEHLELDPHVNKTLIGREPLSDTEFTFHIVQTDGSFANPIENGYTDTVSVGKGIVRFEKILIHQVGTYYYRVSEQIGNAGGMTYDEGIYHITVNVTVNGNALAKNISVVRVGAGSIASSDVLNFTNIYKNTDTADVTLKGNKNLTGRTLLPGEFSFQLSENGNVLQTVTNRADGSFVFDTITYTAADVGTHTYTVTEVKGGKGGVAYDTTAYTVTVTVTDNGLGELVVTTTGADNITFNNTYTAQSANVALSGTKTWINMDLNADKPMAGGEFTFVLYASDASYSTQGQQVASTTNAADGSFGFRLTYNTPGDYYYLLRETKGSAAGTGYDTGVYHIKVVVYDDLNGKLVASVAELREEGTDATSIAFHNTYTPAPAEITISGEKVLTGRNLVDGEFDFQLKQGETVLQTAVNHGKDFTFAPITYTNSGTYTYEVVEVVPGLAVNNLYDGVTYDTSVFTVTVTVIDDGAGQLNATYAVTKNGQQEELVFTNVYEVNTFTSFDLTGTKVLYNTTTGENMNMADFDQKFHLDMFDAAGVRVASAKVGADGKFSFVDVPLITAGTHTFTVKEHNEGLGGITYDTTVYTVTITVTDNGQGSLVAGTPVVTLNDQDAQLKFTNQYALTPISESFYVSKVLENKTLEDDMFTFELVQNGQVIQTVGNKRAGGVYFEAIEYTKPGVYTYTIREVQGNAGGITYDTHEVTVTVTVTDNLDGTMSANVVYEGNTTFTNVYTVTGNPKVTITGSKTLTGREMADGEFTFVLTDAQGNTVEVTNVGTSFTFADVVLNGLGTHTFTVTEKNTGLGGITYDTAVYDVSVTVTDDGQGGMTVGAPVITNNGVAAQLAFQNTYQAEPAELVLTATKQYNKPLAGNDFTFTLVGEGISQTKTNGADGSITFDKLTFSEAKTYTYTVTETNTGKGGVTYDATLYTVTITVTDNGQGQLVVDTVTYQADRESANSVIFENAYHAASVDCTLTATKEYNKPLAGNDFIFTLTGEGVSQTKTNAADGSITFDKLTFDAVGTYTYTVTETNTGKGGVTYDATVYTVTITVTDNGQGQLEIGQVTYVAGGAEKNAIVFENTYTAAPVDHVLTATKQYNKPMTGGEFSFSLTGNGANQTKTNGADGSITFDKLTFDAVGTYTYTVTETAGDKTYVTYDDTVYTVRIDVQDNGQGKLYVASVTYTADQTSANAVVFDNVYTPAPVDHVLTATKQYNKPLAGNDFIFTLTGEGISQTKTNGANGSITFDKLTFDAVGTYTYTVSEKAGDKSYVTYDATVYTVTIVVEDNDQGNLVVASVTYTANGQTANNMVFTNVYTPASVEHALEAEKSYTKELTGGEFEFVLTGNGISQTKTNGVGGTIAFDAVTYDAVGDYVYTVTETNTGKGGVTYDATVYTVTVTVADDEQGKLYISNVTVSDDQASGNGTVKFVNTYTVTGEPVFSVAGTKELTGRDLIDGEFVFVLTDAQGNTVEVTNVGGAFSFNNVALPGLGTYTYTVTEKNTGIGTITYDATVYTVTVTVVDDNEGGMTVETPVITCQGQAAEIRFANIYTKPDPITVDVNIGKVMDGEMSPKDFKFELVQDGKVVSTATADADGKAKMSITFTVDALGTHEFVIREANTGIKHVTYDTNTYKLQITVTETADGQLSAALKVNDADAETVNVQFVNKFDPPATPETGDNSQPMMLVNVMTISLLAMVVMLAVLVIDRKKGQFER